MASLTTTSIADLILHMGSTSRARAYELLATLQQERSIAGWYLTAALFFAHRECSFRTFATEAG